MRSYLCSCVFYFFNILTNVSSVHYNSNCEVFLLPKENFILQHKASEASNIYIWFQIRFRYSRLQSILVAIFKIEIEVPQNLWNVQAYAFVPLKLEFAEVDSNELYSM